MGSTGAACYRFPSAPVHRCRRCDIHIPTRESADNRILARSLWDAHLNLVARLAVVNWLINWPRVYQSFSDWRDRGGIPPAELTALCLDVAQKLAVAPAPWLENMLVMAWGVDVYARVDDKDMIVEIAVRPESIALVGKKPRRRDHEAMVERDVATLCRFGLDGESARAIVISGWKGWTGKGDVRKPDDFTTTVYAAVKRARALLRVPSPTTLDKEVLGKFPTP